MKYFYSALCSVDEERELYRVSFPDLPGCESQSHTVDDALRIARENVAATLLELEEKGIEAPMATEEKILRSRYVNYEICTFLVDMDSYRAYRDYKVHAAAKQSALWAKEKKRKAGFLSRVFGLR